MLRIGTGPMPGREVIGYCGLACGLCVHACEPDCRSGGGPEECVQRSCCREREIDGCWECADFPCDRGYFAEEGDAAFRGICIGSVLCIRVFGRAEYLNRVADRLGNPVEYGDYRYLDSEVARSLLCDGSSPQNPVTSRGSDRPSGGQVQRSVNVSESRIDFRKLSREDIDGFASIDRTETVDRIYYYRDGDLVLQDERWDVKDWSSAVKEEFIAGLHDLQDNGAAVFGAFDGPTLVGLAALSHRPVKTGVDRLNMAELYVSNGYRDQGIGRNLVHLIAQEARRRGARSLYISATPSEHTVRFYRGLGCVLADPVDPDLLAKEPEDIHLELALG